MCVATQGGHRPVARACWASRRRSRCRRALVERLLALERGARRPRSPAGSRLVACRRRRLAAAARRARSQRQHGGAAARALGDARGCAPTGRPDARRRRSASTPATSTSPASRWPTMRVVAAAGRASSSAKRSADRLEPGAQPIARAASWQQVTALDRSAPAAVAPARARARPEQQREHSSARAPVGRRQRRWSCTTSSSTRGSRVRPPQPRRHARRRLRQRAAERASERRRRGSADSARTAATRGGSARARTLQRDAHADHQRAARCLASGSRRRRWRSRRRCRRREPRRTSAAAPGRRSRPLAASAPFGARVVDRSAASPRTPSSAAELACRHVQARRSSIPVPDGHRDAGGRVRRAGRSHGRTRPRGSTQAASSAPRTSPAGCTRRPARAWPASGCEIAARRAGADVDRPRSSSRSRSRAARRVPSARRPQLYEPT